MPTLRLWTVECENPMDFVDRNSVTSFREFPVWLVVYKISYTLQCNQMLELSNGLGRYGRSAPNQRRIVIIIRCQVNVTASPLPSHVTTTTDTATKHPFMFHGARWRTKYSYGTLQYVRVEYGPLSYRSRCSRHALLSPRGGPLLSPLTLLITPPPMPYKRRIGHRTGSRMLGSSLLIRSGNRRTHQASTLGVKGDHPSYTSNIYRR
ncbi:hypothetical protein CBL_06674 [Carabus blaptoides fortunei]